VSRSAWNVLVVGGGTAGCAVAVALGRAGVDGVLVLERTARPGVRVGESIPPDTRLVFGRLGVWDEFAAERHEPCVGSCSSWGDGELAYNDFLFNPHGTGWHLDRPRFDAWLAGRALAAGAQLWRDTRFEGVEPFPGGLRVRLTAPDGSPATVSTQVLVDATGAGAVVARAMGAGRLRQDRLSCVTGHLDAGDFGRLTLLEAVEYGWWYAARVPDGRVAVAVASDPDLVATAGLHTPAGWRAALASTVHLSAQLGAHPPRGRADEALIVRSVHSSTLDQVCGTDWLAVGDAACANDPLAARGIHAALDDGDRAGRLIAARLAGDPAALLAHQATVAARFEDYRAGREFFYRQEERWADAPFWVRRRARSAAPAPAAAIDLAAAGSHR
jgi:flavin-dependent dehydrogenase